MLQAVIDDDGASSISKIARRVGIPIATAHRQVTSLAEFGYLAPISGGRYIAGPNLIKLVYQIDPIQSVVRLGRPIIEQLAKELQTTVHLGSFEGDMVTYCAKAGNPKFDLFTEVGGQLEAYCSGIGKVLLAHLPNEELMAYLASGPFVALTPNTITDVGELTSELAKVKANRLAYDRGEIEEGLHCVAVPIFAPDGSVPLALSASFREEAATAEILRKATASLVSAQSAIEEMLSRVGTGSALSDCSVTR